jgi:uncharacterized protein with PIN domain
VNSLPQVVQMCGLTLSCKEKHNSEKEKCEECGEEFDTVKALKLHSVLHENREELICKYCGKVFRYPCLICQQFETTKKTLQHNCVQ